MRAMALALICLGAAPAAAAELYCLAESSVNWSSGAAQSLSRASDPQGHSGWFEFWINTETGKWSGRTIGSRALYTDGGRYSIQSDGTGYRTHWVGNSPETNAESLRIALGRKGMPYLRVTRDGLAEIGSCRDASGHSFFDGEEMAP